MANPFAASKSGMSSMIESMLPPDVMDAIRIAKEQLPNVIASVQQSVERIESKINEIQANVLVLKSMVLRLSEPANRINLTLDEVTETELSGANPHDRGDGNNQHTRD